MPRTRERGIADEVVASVVEELGWDGEVVRADTFVRRLFGLMREVSRRPSIMLFDACRSVHTCFMPCDIDVAFIDVRGHVVRVEERVGPWRFLRCPNAQAVLERVRV